MDSVAEMNKVLSALRKKYRHADMIMTFTKDMEKSLNMSDEESMKILLDMRQKQMDIIDKIDLEISITIDNMPLKLREKMNTILRPAGEVTKLENPMETNIFDLNRQILSLMKKIVDLNNSISLKMQKK